MVDIRSVGLSAYRSAMQTGSINGLNATPNVAKTEKSSSSFATAVDTAVRKQRLDEPITAARAQELAKQFMEVEKPFSETVTESLTKVNELQADKKAMIEDFASGRTQNVHELMISLQKAGVAMRMTSAVRNKVMEAYKKLSQMHF
ncbi:flagellar hook-basal body complex protein FliE [Desulfobaculum sp.]